jgi:hypothetical protein
MPSEATEVIRSARVEKRLSRQAYNLEIAGSNPAPDIPPQLESAMNPILSILLSLALSQIKPEMILGLLTELVQFLDPIVAQRSFAIRWAWSFVKGQLTSPSIAKEVADLLGSIEAKLAAAKAEQKIVAADYSPL